MKKKSLMIKIKSCNYGHKDIYIFSKNKTCSICKMYDKYPKISKLFKKSLNFPYSIDKDISIIKITINQYAEIFKKRFKDLESNLIKSAIIKIYWLLSRDYVCQNPSFIAFILFYKYLQLIYNISSDDFYQYFKFENHNRYFMYIVDDLIYKIEDALNIKDILHYRIFFDYTKSIDKYPKKIQWLNQLVLKYDYAPPIEYKTIPVKNNVNYKLNLKSKIKNKKQRAIKEKQKNKIMIIPKKFHFHKIIKKTKKIKEIRKEEPNIIQIEPKKKKKNIETLFSIDLNNLNISLRHKYRNYRNLNPMDFVEKFYPKENFMSLVFCSKHLSHLKIEKEDTNKKGEIKWFIESYIKKKKTKEYCDIDTTLSAITYHALFQFRNTLKKFYLFSGDKDFHLLIETANRLGINTYIIAVEENNISDEMKKLANQFAYL